MPLCNTVGHSMSPDPIPVTSFIFVTFRNKFYWTVCCHFKPKPYPATVSSLDSCDFHWHLHPFGQHLASTCSPASHTYLKPTSQIQQCQHLSTTKKQTEQNKRRGCVVVVVVDCYLYFLWLVGCLRQSLPLALAGMNIERPGWAQAHGNPLSSDFQY